MARTLTIDDLIVWYYDDRNVTGGYVLLESDDPTTMQRVQHALISAGLHCRKHGACFRAAHNKKMYKTFIRVEQSSGESPALAVIKGAIKTLPNAHYDANPVEIRMYVNRLSETIAQKDAAITALQQRLQESRQELSTLLRQREHEHASLQAQPGSDPAAPLDPVGIAPHPVEDREATYRAMEMYEQQLHEREACIRQLQADLQQAVYARDHASAENFDLRERVLQAQYASQEDRAARLDEQDEFSQILRTLLPNLEFMGNSIPFMRTEVRDRSQIYAYLYRLNNHDTMPLKAFRGTEGWMEVNKKISDGQSHTVRIYTLKKHDPPGTYRVLVSEKSEQARDTERLRRYT